VERCTQFPSYVLAVKGVDADDTIRVPPPLTSTYMARGQSTIQELVDRQRSRFLQKCNFEPQILDDEGPENVGQDDGESSDDEA